MATATGTNVKFVKVRIKQQYEDYQDKDGALIFVESERKIYVDGTAYGFSNSDVAGKFLELVGGTMSGDIDMNDNGIDMLSYINFRNGGGITQEDGMEFRVGADRKILLRLGKDGNNIIFDADDIRGIPEPAVDSSPISKGYLETNVINKKGVANGFASLDSSGQVPSAQLPSYVDDVVEYSAKASFPATGESGKLYIDLSNNNVWRWGGSAYVNVSDGNAHLTLGTTAGTAYNGKDGLAAFNHSKLTSGNPHGVTASDVELGSVVNQGLATKAQAEAGTINTAYMTPLRTKEAVEKLAPKLSWEVYA